MTNIFTWHLCYTVQINKLFDCLVTTAYRMPQSTLFLVQYIANRPDPAGSSQTLLSCFHRPSAHMSTPAAGMQALMLCDQGMADNKTGSIAHSS